MLDPRTELANNFEQFDLFSSRNESYDNWGQENCGTKSRKTAQNYENHWNWNGEEVELKPLSIEDESGFHSPPLWTTSPQRSPVHPRHHVINHRALSPASRSQAIARGQRELMEMVNNMPDSCFELSLKDIVEHPRKETQEECLLKDQKHDHDHQVLAHQKVRIKRQESKNNSEKKAKMMRSGSMENRGLFLKMVFPVSLKSKKKKNMMKNNSISNSTSAKVSPKPEISDRTNSKSVDKDWWKKRFSAPSDQSESSRSSSNNSGSSGSSGSYSSSRSSIRNKSSTTIKCLPCFHSTKSKSTQ